MMTVENGSQALESKTVADKKIKGCQNNKKRTPHWVSIYHHAQRVYHQYPWVLYIIRPKTSISRFRASISSDPRGLHPGSVIKKLPALPQYSGGANPSTTGTNLLLVGRGFDNG